MAPVLPYIAVASSVMQAQQQNAAGKYNQSIQNRNAQIAEQEAQQIEKQKEFDLQRFDQNIQQLEGQTITRIAKTGADFSGTGLRILRNNAEQAEVEKNVINYNSKVAAAQRREAGNMFRIQGQFARQAGRAAAISTLVSAGTTFAGSSAGKSLLTNIPNPFRTRDLTSTEGSF
jgi:mannitol-specific phosphotransferase system IIBC component